MADEQEAEAVTEQASEEPNAVAGTGTQKLETKQIQGQVITHTVVKPLRDGEQ